MTLEQLRVFISKTMDLPPDTPILMEDEDGWGHQLIDIEMGTALIQKGEHEPVIIIGELSNSESFETGRDL